MDNFLELHGFIIHRDPSARGLNLFLIRGCVMKIYKKLKRKYRRLQGRREVAKHGVWFVDIPRTSSTSIRVELGKYWGPVYGKSNVIEKKYITEKVFNGHQTAQKMSVFLGEELWERLFTFTMVRNPWDRTYSMFNYRRKRGKIPICWSFRDYVLELDRNVYNLSQGNPASEYFSYHATRCSSAYYISDADGNIMVDYVAKYENRTNDLTVIASRVGIKQLGDLVVQSASPKSKHYSQFYDEETKDIIRSLYADDIELFSYEFEDES